MKRTLLFIISILVGVGLFVFSLLHAGFDSIGRVIQEFSFGELFVILALSFAQLLVTTWRWKLILNVQGYMPRYKNLLAAKLVGFSVDYFTPSPNIGGEAVRAYVLKKEMSIPFSQGLASVIIDKVMDFTYALPFVVGGIFYALTSFSLTRNFVIGLLIVSVIFIGLMAFFYLRMFAKKDFFSFFMRFAQMHRFKGMQRILERMKEFEQIIIAFFHDHRRTFFVSLFISFIAGTIAIAQFWSAMLFLDLQANIFHAFIVATLTIVTFLLPIPGSLGSQEIGETLIFDAMGFGASTGLVFSLVIRFPDILKGVFGLGYLSHFGIRFGQGAFATRIREENQHERRSN